MGKFVLVTQSIVLCFVIENLPKTRQAKFKNGINGFYGTHTLRKTFGYHHYHKFKDVALLQKIFNHYSPSITLRYIGIDQEEINNSYLNFIL